MNSEKEKRKRNPMAQGTQDKMECTVRSEARYVHRFFLLLFF